MLDQPYQPVQDAVASLQADVSDLLVYAALGRVYDLGNVRFGDDVFGDVPDLERIAESNVVTETACSALELVESCSLLDDSDPLRWRAGDLATRVAEMCEAASVGDMLGATSMSKQVRQMLSGIEDDIDLRTDHPQRDLWSEQPLRPAQEEILLVLLELAAYRGSTASRNDVEEYIGSGGDLDRSWALLKNQGWISGKRGRGNGYTLTHKGLKKAEFLYRRREQRFAT